MKSIHIRDVDPEVIARLKKLARMHHRSMQGELRAILAEAAERVPVADDADTGGLVTVNLPGKQTWKREEMYGDDAR